MIQASRVYFQCDRCGEIIEYEADLKGTEYFLKNKCWSITLPRGGYPSKFDGQKINFDVCDNCLYEIIDNFKYKSRIIRED